MVSHGKVAVPSYPLDAQRKKFPSKSRIAPLMHWNNADTGAGRADYKPMCRREPTVSSAGPGGITVADPKKQKAVQTAAPNKAYEQMAEGSEGCPQGTEIATKEECMKAHSALGWPQDATATVLANGLPWEGSSSIIPIGCSTKKFPSKSRIAPLMHWNTADTGAGRADYKPMCRREPTVSSAGPGGITVADPKKQKAAQTAAPTKAYEQMA